jgi:hypothetical protein
VAQVVLSQKGLSKRVTKMTQMSREVQLTVCFSIMKTFRIPVAKWMKTCSTLGDTRSVHRTCIRKPVNTRPPVKRTRRREDNIKMHLTEYDVKAWTGFKWLRIGYSGGFL